MAFESGSVGFRTFYLPNGMPHNAIERFADNSAPPITTLGSDEISGWVSGRHLLDHIITEENALYAGYLRLTLMKAERKIPEALLRAECKIEELALMQAEGLSYVKREQRSQIKKEVTARLLPSMPPSLIGIPTVYDSDHQLLYAGAMSEKQVDALTINFKSTQDCPMIPMNAITAAMRLKKIDVSMLEPTSFSPKLENPLAHNAIGQDFLTWLWFFSESRGGIMSVNGTSYAVMVEGPLTFFMEGAGAHVTLLRNGTPEISAEAKTALLSGKKLLRARITIGGEHENWSTSLDAQEFIFRGFKLPKTEKVDAITGFQQRMMSLNRFNTVFMAFYDRFLSYRLNQNKWAAEQKDIHEWVSNRQSKC
ncbi:MAG: recombination-associated protein RdgC [Kiritimatiellae bacterium]|nr:recombination-associated protein RdgC [Kiritimatiellia bacterium]